MKANQTASWLISLTIILLALSYGQHIIIPFVVALFIWFIVKKTRNLIDKIPFAKNYIPRWIKTGIASLGIFGLLLMFTTMLSHNIEGIINSYKNYQSNIDIISEKINDLLNIDLHEELDEFKESDYPNQYLTALFNSISGILGNAIMILFYTIFLFVEESLFQFKLRIIFSDKQQREQFDSVLLKIDRLMADYISLKSLVSTMTALLSYFVLLFVGIDSPFFWAALIFFFNFIPSVGSIIATLLPALFCLIQFGNFAPFLIVLFIVGTIQVVVGNYIEPRLMGNTLNISPLVAIISLAIWGAIWGILGMLLSVPITVALIVILSQFQSTRSIAILMSEKGRI